MLDFAAGRPLERVVVTFVRDEYTTGCLLPSVLTDGIICAMSSSIFLATACPRPEHPNHLAKLALANRSSSQHFADLPTCPVAHKNLLSPSCALPVPPTHTITEVSDPHDADYVTRMAALPGHLEG